MRATSIHQAGAALALVVFCTGCTTWVTSQPASYVGSDGVRTERGGLKYALPIPVLKVVPQTDGTIAVEVIYLPDPQNEYVVTAGSFLAKYTLDVTTDENRLLTSMSMNQDAANVAAKLVTQGSEVAKAALDERKARRDAEAKDKATARDAVLAAEQAVAEADTKIKFYEELLKNATGALKTELEGQLRAAQLEKKLAETKLMQARDKLRRISSSGFNIAAAGEPPLYPPAWGPVLFRVEQTAPKTGVKDWVTGKPIAEKVPDVHLIALFEQRPFDTSAIASPTLPTPGPITFTLRGPPVIMLQGGVFPAREIEISTTVASVDEGRAELIPAGAPTPRPDLTPKLNLQPDRRTVFFNLSETTPAGVYSLRFPVTTAGGTTMVSGVSFTVAR